MKSITLEILWVLKQNKCRSITHPDSLSWNPDQNVKHQRHVQITRNYLPSKENGSVHKIDDKANLLKCFQISISYLFCTKKKTMLLGVMFTCILYSFLFWQGVHLNFLFCFPFCLFRIPLEAGDFPVKDRQLLHHARRHYRGRVKVEVKKFNLLGNGNYITLAHISGLYFGTFNS